nr:serine protease [Nostoc sp. DedQUE07]MDZ8130896.1 serine protease [Nostoc sp. DedQUE07]
MSWELVKACTVAIATPEGYIQGTGFFISPNGHLLTCAHVVESAGGWEEVRVNEQRVELVYLGDRTLTTKQAINVLCQYIGVLCQYIDVLCQCIDVLCQDIDVLR